MIKAFLLELKEIKSSFFLLSLLTWIPLVSFLLIIAIFHKGIASNLPVGVIDNDKTKLSRMIISQINTNQTVTVKKQYSSLKEAKEDLNSAKIYAIIVIPNHFYKDVMTKKQPNITAFINTQYLLIGKMIKKALSSTIMQSSGAIEFINNLVKTKEPHLALAKTKVIDTKITPFFNTYLNYFLFLVSAIIPTLWQILIAISIVLSFGKTFKEKKENLFFKNQNIILATIGKTLPYTIAYMLWGSFFIYYMYVYEPWSFVGDFSIVFLAMLLTILAYEGVILLFFTLNFHTTRALSLTALYTAPAFAFLGITFPVSSMGEFATLWHNLLPISHYLKIQIAEASYGSSIEAVLPHLKSLSLFLPVWIIVFFKIKRRVG